MIKRVLNSGLWFGAAAVLSLAMLQPALAGGCCTGVCADQTTCLAVTWQGEPNFYYCTCYADNGTCTNKPSN
jgi:hypothetical protein